MKYWVFQNNQVTGPFDREQLSQVAGFSADSLVCPEGRKGTQMGDWQRAGLVPELADSALKTSRISALARAGSGGAGAGALPPEPTLRDLAALGSLQEKVALLEGALGRLQEDMRARDTEISRLKVELDQRSRATADLQGKVGDLETRLVAAQSLKEDVLKAKEDAKAAAAKLDAQDRLLRELQAKSGPSKGEFRGEIHDAGLEPPPIRAGSPLESFISPSGKSAAGEPASPPMGMGEGRSMMGKLGALESDQPPSFGSQDPLSGFGGAGPAPMERGGDLAGGLLMGGATEAAGSAELSPQGARKAKSLPIVHIAVGLAVAVTAGFYFYGQGGKKKRIIKPPASPAGLDAPVPGAVGAPAGTPSVQAGPEDSDSATDQTQAAVEFAKSYRLPGGEETVGRKLESLYPASGGLSPWMVEKVENDKYQVNFYSSKSEPGSRKKVVFEFAVRLKSKQLQGLNPHAVALLNGAPLPAAVPARLSRARTAALSADKKGRKRRRRPGIIPSALESRKSGGPIEPASSEAPKETVLPPEEPAAGGSSASKSDEEMTLDQLLLPGSKGGKKAPAAQDETAGGQD